MHDMANRKQPYPKRASYADEETLLAKAQHERRKISEQQQKLQTVKARVAETKRKRDALSDPASLALKAKNLVATSDGLHQAALVVSEAEKTDVSVFTALERAIHGPTSEEEKTRKS